MQPLMQQFPTSKTNRRKTCHEFCSAVRWVCVLQINFSVVFSVVFEISKWCHITISLSFNKHHFVLRCLRWFSSI